MKSDSIIPSFFVLPYPHTGVEESKLKLFLRNADGKQIGDLTVSPQLDQRYSKAVPALFNQLNKSNSASQLTISASPIGITKEMLNAGLELHLSPFQNFTQNSTKVVKIGKNLEKLDKTIKAFYKDINNVQARKTAISKNYENWTHEFFPQGTGGILNQLDVLESNQEQLDEIINNTDNNIKSANKIFIGLMLILTAIGLACSFKLWRDRAS